MEEVGSGRMKKIGLVGGTGPESTLREFNAIIKKMMDEYKIEAVILG